MKYIFGFLGLFFLFIGSIGIFIPILPTTPFYLLSLFLFSKSSEELKNKFQKTKLYKKHLEHFYKSRTMEIKTKIMILSF